jgi:hypothetical protein
MIKEKGQESSFPPLTSHGVIKHSRDYIEKRILELTLKHQVQVHSVTEDGIVCKEKMMHENGINS